MAGLQVGRKIHTINEDLLFLRPFSEVETMISQAFCVRRSLRLLVATKAKEWANTHKYSGTSIHAQRTLVWLVSPLPGLWRSLTTLTASPSGSVAPPLLMSTPSGKVSDTVIFTTGSFKKDISLCSSFVSKLHLSRWQMSCHVANVASSRDEEWLSCSFVNPHRQIYFLLQTCLTCGSIQASSTHAVFLPQGPQKSLLYETFQMRYLIFSLH